MKIGIVGNGHVGVAMSLLFPDAIIYDEPHQIGSREDINQCDLAFVCVPTPMREDGSCDIQIVDSVLNWIKTPLIVLRSTVPVGYTSAKCVELSKRIVFQPEYYGETTAHPFQNLIDRTWITLGGAKADVYEVLNVYKTVYNSTLRIRIVDAKTAELAKYMENAFLALKVTFCNEFYDISKAMDVSYDELRETWLEDPRIGRSHTFVYPDNRGFGGSCLPKDVHAIAFQAQEQAVDIRLLNAVIEKNDAIRNGNKQ